MTTIAATRAPKHSATSVIPYFVRQEKMLCRGKYERCVRTEALEACRHYHQILYYDFKSPECGY